MPVIIKNKLESFQYCNHPFHFDFKKYFEKKFNANNNGGIDNPSFDNYYKTVYFLLIMYSNFSYNV